ncbi:MAG TPA: cation:proton antiporter [Pseudonocardiaceae bacterium]|nr:cation:proton antiporter [Pseudonocardiaceae bacterium]
MGFAWLLFGAPPDQAAFLGIVLSVTAISVVASLLIERGQTRREFTHVVLAGGITTELCGWVFVAVAAAAQHGSPLPVAGRARGRGRVLHRRGRPGTAAGRPGDARRRRHLPGYADFAGCPRCWWVSG